MIFWLVVFVALLLSVALIRSNDVYYMRQIDEAVGMIIGAATIGAVIMRLLS